MAGRRQRRIFPGTGAERAVAPPREAYRRELLLAARLQTLLQGALLHASRSG